MCSLRNQSTFFLETPLANSLTQLLLALFCTTSVIQLGIIYVYSQVDTYVLPDPPTSINTVIFNWLAR